MTRFAGWIFPTLFLLPSILPAQAGEKPFPVHPAIGDTLWRADRDRFQLLPMLEGFRYATFALNPDSTLAVRVHLESQGTEKDTLIPRYRTLASFRRHIDSMQPVERITMKDGSVLVGIVERRRGDSIAVRTQGMGTVRIAAPAVDRIEPYETPDRFEFPATPAPAAFRDSLVDPNSTRAFIMPTAQTLPGGHGYIANYELFLLSVAIALNDYVMINGGMLLIPGLFGSENQIYNFGVRVGFAPARSKTAFGIGAQFLTIPDESPVGLAYGVVSFGDADAKLSLGAGVAFETGRRYWYSSPPSTSAVGAVSGESRISRSVKLLGELWIIPGAEALPVILGVRFFGGQLSGDIGLLFFLGGSTQDAPGFPVVNLVYNF